MVALLITKWWLSCTGQGAQRAPDSSNCVFLYWVILRVMLVDQIKQVLHWRIILWFRFLQILLQHFLQFFYNATILPN